MDEIETRLKEASENCIKAYEAWNKSKKSPPERERLQEAMHELRKVTARLEIEMAASEREEITQRPIPIPPHRSSRRRPGEELPGFIRETGNGDDDRGNVPDNDQQPLHNEGRQHTAPRNSNHNNRSGGGGGSGGFQRRPMRRPQASQDNQPSSGGDNED